MADEALSAGAVARRLGVAVTTLRTWHQRYGLGPSRHEPGQHRRYTAQDLNRLEVMLRLTAQGVAPAEAAAWARRDDPATGPTRDSGGRPARDGGGRPAGDGGGRPAGDGGGLPVRDGGGQAIPLGPVVPAARGLARAAMRLDAAAMRDILEAVVASHGVIDAWTDVAMPVLIGIGERYQATRRYIEVEHLVSRCVTEVLGAVPRPPSATPPRVLLAAADEEQHTLPLEALAAALAEAGVPTRLLGGRVPPSALADTVTRTGPTVVVLWSQLPGTGDATQLTRLLTHPHPPLAVAAAGPGWPTELPAGVTRLTGLPSGVAFVRSAVA